MTQRYSPRESTQCKCAGEDGITFQPYTHSLATTFTTKPKNPLALLSNHKYNAIVGRHIYRMIHSALSSAPVVNQQH